MTRTRAGLQQVSVSVNPKAVRAPIQDLIRRCALG
jgi:hypothetical protein